jgi:methionyl-tRNA formyltransferase
VKWSEANSTKAYEWIKRLTPQWIVLFGSSIIKEPLLSHYQNQIINMHLGLSPYYRGSSTNFWPLVDGLPECVGVTVHHAVLSVDAGPILAQGRPDVSPCDRSHDFGCKTIIKGAQLVIKTLKMLERAMVPGVVQTGGGKLCRRNDFRPEVILKLEENFDRGMVPEYLANKKARDRRFPIVLLP